MELPSLLDELDGLVLNASTVPLTSGKVIVDRETLVDLLDRIRVAVPEDVSEAQWILQEHDERGAGGNGALDAAADARLDQIAGQLQALLGSQRAERERNATQLAGATGEQVRDILEAAEESADTLRRKAERESRQMVEDARRWSAETRNKGATEAAEHIRRVEEATAALLKRAGIVDTEISALLESVRQPAGSIVELLSTRATSLQEELEAIATGLTRMGEMGGGAVRAQRKGPNAGTKPTANRQRKRAPVPAGPATESYAVGEAPRAPAPRPG